MKAMPSCGTPRPEPVARSFFVLLPAAARLVPSERAVVPPPAQFQPRAFRRSHRTGNARACSRRNLLISDNPQQAHVVSQRGATMGVLTRRYAMAMNQVQFQRGLSMAEFLDRYGTEDKCEAALVAARWPGALPARSCERAGTRCSGAPGRRYWQCAACRHQCSVISGTVFEATKLPLTRWFVAMHLLTQAKNNVSALELKRHLGVCYKTAWLMKHKLMEVMRQREDSRVLDGRVEIDDAYLGGERWAASADAAPRTRCPSSPRCKPPRRAGRCTPALPSSHSPTRRWRCGRRNRWRDLGPCRVRRTVVLSWASRSSALTTSPSSPAAARPAPSCRSSRPSTRCWAT